MEEIKIAQVTDTQDKLSDDQKKTFLNPADIKVFRLKPGEVLWRFISKKKAPRFSDCWVDGETMNYLMSLFYQSVGSFPTRKEKQKIVAGKLAVLDKWSHMSWRVKIKLQKEVIAYKGATAIQRLFEDTDRTFALAKGAKVQKLTDIKHGGATQYVIPRFKGKKDENEFAVVTHFAML